MRTTRCAISTPSSIMKAMSSVRRTDTVPAPVPFANGGISVNAA